MMIFTLVVGQLDFTPNSKKKAMFPLLPTQMLIYIFTSLNMLHLTIASSRGKFLEVR
jgi:hypothetical protein